MKVSTALKHLFIPHDKNDYKPHFFRELSVAIVLFVSIFLLGASAGSSFFIHKTVKGASIAASALIDLTNESRIQFNEAPLVRNELLDQAATLKGNDMVSKGYFAHNSPEGLTPWHWLSQAGYDFLYAGENLAINFTDSTDVKNAWLKSPGHRANLLNVRFREIGVATVEGIYNNYPTIFVIQMFGTPASIVVAETKEDISSTKSSALAVTTTTNGSTTPDGSVKGESTGAQDTILPILTTNELAVVKDTSKSEFPLETVSAPLEKYSTWYGRLLFRGSRYVGMIFQGMIILIAFALLTMILVEIRKQHYKHISYGLFMFVVLMIFVYINRGFF